MFVLSFQKYVSELSTVRDCVETCVEKGNNFHQKFQWEMKTLFVAAKT